jgi:hypothetical protein
MDGSYVEAALEAALRRFQRPEHQQIEQDLETNGDEALVQLRKACRLLEAARTLRANDGYDTSVIELSFAATERSLQFYLIHRGGYEPTEFFDHETVYTAGTRQGVNIYSDEVAEQFRTLWSQNRSALYYRGTLATHEQADAMFVLAESVHRWIIEFASITHECRCSTLPDNPYREHTDTNP